jgi:hypothetical protein
MMRRRFVLALAAVLLAACGSSPVAVAPPAVPTRVPLRAVNLEPVLIQDGDLPSGLSPAQVFDAPPPAFKDYPAATKAAYQRFQRAGDTAGGVTVLLYEQAADLANAAAQAVPTKKDYQSVEGVGERAALFVPELLTVRQIGFVRCQAVVNVVMDQVEPDELIAYAKRLDRRLQGMVC